MNKYKTTLFLTYLLFHVIGSAAKTVWAVQIICKQFAFRIWTRIYTKPCCYPVNSDLMLELCYGSSVCNIRIRQLWNSN